MKHLPLLTGLMGIILSVNLHAVELPTVFQAGTPAKAAEVNANFATLKDAINAIQASSTQKATYNAADFLPTSNIAKLFELKLTGVVDPQEIEQVIILDTDGNGDTLYQIIFELGQFGDDYRKLNFVLNSKGYVYKGYHSFFLSGIPDQIIRFEPGIVRFPAIFSVADTFANDTKFTRLNGSEVVSTSETIYKGAIIEIVDVTVPAGSYQNCVKVLQDTLSSRYTKYYCPGVGKVKEVRSSTGSSHSLVLQSVEPVTQEILDSIPDYVDYVLN